MATQQLLQTNGRQRTDRLASASEQLDAVLESVDLEDEPALADALLDAIKATDRAYQLSITR